MKPTIKGGFICNICVKVSHLPRGIFYCFVSLETVKTSSGQMRHPYAYVPKESTLNLNKKFILVFVMKWSYSDNVISVVSPFYQLNQPFLSLARTKYLFLYDQFDFHSMSVYRQCCWLVNRVQPKLSWWKVTVTNMTRNNISSNLLTSHLLPLQTCSR